MSKIIIFGEGKIADEAYFYISNDSPHEIIAFTADADYVRKKELFGRPVLPFEDIENEYPPDEFKMFVALGYQDLNRLRAAKYNEAKAKGYELISYISSKASNFGNVEVGDNCFVLDGAIIQPCATVGNNVFLWSGNHVGHHATVQDHCYIAGQVVISGSTVVEPYCFLGVNSTIGHEITIGRESIIGAGSLITKSVPPKSVHIVPQTPKYRLDSHSFLKLTKL